MEVYERKKSSETARHSYVEACMWVRLRTSLTVKLWHLNVGILTNTIRRFHVSNLYVTTIAPKEYLYK